MRNAMAVVLLMSFLLGVTACTVSSKESKPEKKTVSYEAKDGLKITADLYTIGDEGAPFIMLFHQAGSSRGEYAEIAPKFNSLGFNCMAVDQRSGDGFNGVQNETFAAAIEKLLGTNYMDAYPDMEASLAYVKANYKPEKLLVWGSSYSASLCMPFFCEYSSSIDGILAFSPGEYFTFKDKSVSDYSKNVTCPVFVTAGSMEAGPSQEIYKAISSGKSVFFLPEKGGGVHGSSTLLEETENNKEYWDAVKAFLKDHFQ